MTLQDFREYCLSLKETEADFPFGGTTLVMKVKGKMFALTDIALFESINVKCDPEKAIELRAEYESVRPGWHMDKKHWNTIEIDGFIRDEQIYEWIFDSYNLVVAKLPKKDRF